MLSPGYHLLPSSLCRDAPGIRPAVLDFLCVAGGYIMVTTQRFSRRVAAALVVGALGSGLACVPAQAVRAPDAKVLVGAVGDVAGLSGLVGAPLAAHPYATLSGEVPQASTITVNTFGTWSQMAGAIPGRTIYANAVRWARALKERPGTTYLAYGHEPEIQSKISRGTATDFIAAYRRLVQIFREEGVTNVRFVWQMTAYAFRAPKSDRRHAQNWYPGDDVVDVVGVDAYNWFTCGVGVGAWNTMATLSDPALAFAQQRGKLVSMMEYGATDDPRKAEWLADAHAFFAAHRDVIISAFYFHRPPTDPNSQDCQWVLTSPTDIAAFTTLANDTETFTYELPTD